MKTVDQVLSEPSPSTVNYRSDGNQRETLKNLIDNVPQSSSNGKSKGTTSNSPPVGKLNWVNGVFIPVLLNIWGVIMFLRLGWVVGQAGLILGTVIIIVANLVTGLTSLSLCAICTNGEVQGGGVYFLISRALGPVYGGTIGILFFIAQAVAVSLYIVGFAEAVIDLILEEGGDYITGDETNDIRLIGFVTCTALFLMSLIGIGWYAKTQTALLVILVVSILSVYLGAFMPKVPDEVENIQNGFVGFREVTKHGFRNLKPNFQIDPTSPSETQGFFTVFAVFFPAVTGIMAGANLSGDLDDASKAIPKGTLSAVAVTFVSYVLLLWFVGLTCLACVEFLPDEEISISMASCSFGKLTSALLDDKNFHVPEAGLLYDRLIMKRVSFWAPLVYLGVFAATLSSALASLVGAPRILQSVANDKLFPWAWFNFFGKGRGAGNEPIRGYCVTYAIGVACIAIGKLDTIAPIISNFFMISYALTNYACFASSTSKAPNWRPSFKYYSSFLSGFGAILCVVVMFLIEWLTALITVIFAAGLMYYLKELSPDINWGEAGEAKKYTNALESLETLQLSDKEHVKTFRPQFLVMTGELFSRIWLVKFVSLFSGGGGIMLCADVISQKQSKKVANENNLGATLTENGSLENIGNGSENSTNTEGASDGGVRGLFGAPEARTETASIDSGSSDEVMPPQSASELAAEFEYVKQKRKEGDNFLNNKHIWSGKRCKGAFFDAVISSSLFSGFQKVLQLGGIGKMRPNAVVVGFKSDYLQRSTDEIADYERMLRSVLSVQLGLLVVRDDKYVFELNMNKTPESFLPSLNKLVLRDNDNDSEPGDKRDLEQGLSGMLDQDFKQEVNGTPERDVVPNDAQNWSNGGSKSSMEFKERIEHYKAGDGDYIDKFENSLPTDIKGDFIDVWWLADDGGLTMLLPQLLIQNPLFKGKNLRVMAVTNKFQNAEETSRLKKAELRMVHLLHKFRIKATTLGIDLNTEQALNPATKERFEKCMGIRMEDLDKTEAAKTQYNLRLAEEIRKTSRQASIVFMILPIPESTLRVKLHTTWLDMVSYDMPPMVMMRGNNENVLTFFC